MFWLDKFFSIRAVRCRYFGLSEIVCLRYPLIFPAVASHVVIQFLQTISRAWTHVEEREEATANLPKHIMTRNCWLVTDGMTNIMSSRHFLLAMANHTQHSSTLGCKQMRTKYHLQWPTTVQWQVLKWLSYICRFQLAQASHLSNSRASRRWHYVLVRLRLWKYLYDRDHFPSGVSKSTSGLWLTESLESELAEVHATSLCRQNYIFKSVYFEIATS